MVVQAWEGGLRGPGLWGLVGGVGRVKQVTAMTCASVGFSGQGERTGMVQGLGLCR